MKLITQQRARFLMAQGYQNYSHEQLSEMAFGIRFAFRLSVSILIIGVATAHIPTLVAMMSIAFLSVLLPNHPFDYLYNYLLAKRMGKPKLPKRDIRLKFACGMATLWIAGTIWLFASGSTTAGYILGASLIAASSSVAS